MPLAESEPCYVGPVHHGMVHPQVADGEMAFIYRRYLWIKQLWTADNEWSSSLKVGQGANNSSQLETSLYKMLHRTLNLVGSCEHGNEPFGCI